MFLAMARYLSRLSGPLLDRIDIQVEVSPVPFEQWAACGSLRQEEPSSLIAERVEQARLIQRERFSGREFSVNARITARELRRYCSLDAAGLRLLEAAARKMGLSARSLDRALRVARTIADLESSPDVGSPHLAEAMQYRSLERLNP